MGSKFSIELKPPKYVGKEDFRELKSGASGHYQTDPEFQAQGCKLEKNASREFESWQNNELLYYVTTKSFLIVVKFFF